MFSSNTTQVASAAAVYIEEIFSTFLYSGNDSTQTITNNIDISTKGALVWVKGRSGTYGTWDHTLITTPISNTVALSSNTTGNTFGIGASAFSPTTTGFNLNTVSASLNNNGTNYVSWTFRKQPKFFDVVTYTGNGTTQNIAHNLGSAPGCVIVKTTSNAGYNWAVYHRSLSSGDNLRLNTTDSSSGAALGPGGFGDNTSVVAPTSTVFTVGNNGNLNNSGFTYVAYVFAHNAGGFGLTGTDNVITCDSFTTDGSGNATVNLGYEPQWVIAKAATGTISDWFIFDNMRGFALGDSNYLRANSTATDTNTGPNIIFPTATGFSVANSTFDASSTYVYIAIRRGPMKVPTDATKVFAMATALGTDPAFVSNAVVDMGFNVAKNSASIFFNQSRLVGPAYLNTRSTAAETSEASRTWDYMKGMISGQSANTNNVGYMYGRAPSFFDVVCYTGTGTNQFLNHNLGVRPDLYIVKRRNFAANWVVTINASIPDTVGILNSTNAFGGSAYDNGYLVNGTIPASNFGAGYGSVNNDAANRAGNSYIAYLFATCAGISKVGSYTGNGTTQTIDCGFGAGGARFVLIKRTDSTGDWYVYDTLRGMTVLTDPYLLMNSAAAETATLGSVTTVSTGFAVNASILAAINTNAASYIFLAIA